MHAQLAEMNAAREREVQAHLDATDEANVLSMEINELADEEFGLGDLVVWVVGDEEFQGEIISERGDAVGCTKRYDVQGSNGLNNIVPAAWLTPRATRIDDGLGVLADILATIDEGGMATAVQACRGRGELPVKALIDVWHGALSASNTATQDQRQRALAALPPLWTPYEAPSMSGGAFDGA
jgi:hypothetical protein